MNKFKLALFAVIAAGAVGGGAGAADVSAGSVVSDSGVSPTQTYVPHTGIYKTLRTLDMDLNKDGVLDIVKFRGGSVTGYQSLYIEAHINNGDGTSYTNETAKYFGKIGNKYASAGDAEAVDINDDGLLDILPFANCFDDGGNDGCLPPIIQQADGSFEVTSNPLLQTLTDGVYKPVDIDGDGDMDIIHQNLLANNNAEYDFELYGSRWGDANHDRQEWEVFENRSENGVAKFVHYYDVMKNTPVGVGDLHGAWTHGVELADINGDGKLDVLFGGARATTIMGPQWDTFDPNADFTLKMSVYLGNGDFTFTFSKDSWLGDSDVYESIGEIHSADLDSDGDLDFIVTDGGKDFGDYAGGLNSILWNSNGKLFKDTGTKDTFGYMGFTHQYDMADVDNDGDMDVVFWDMGGADIHCEYDWSQQMRVLKNDGKGGFTNVQTTCLDPYEKADVTYQAYFAVSMTLADMNGDGFVDIIAGESSEYGVDRVVFNNGDGTFNFRKADDILVK